jgi:predicted CXXCH cytochrome family protein
MLKKLVLLTVIVASGIVLISSQPRPSSAQDALAAFKGNNCVTCHSRLNSPYKLTSRYAEWHVSIHKDKGVGCDKCHGGDPGTNDTQRAHYGVLAIADAKSKLNPKNLAETCSACHKEIVNSFVESKHYQNLQGAGLGPSCNTCHAHMASEVIYTPEQAAKLCANCHDSANALLPKRPEIPGKADEAMQALKRANLVTVWADRLLEEAQNKKVDVGDAVQEMKIVRAMLAESKASWHAFNLEVVRKKADAAFEAGTRQKDALRSKLYPNQ